MRSSSQRRYDQSGVRSRSSYRGPAFAKCSIRWREESCPLARLVQCTSSVGSEKRKKERSTPEKVAVKAMLEWNRSNRTRKSLGGDPFCCIVGGGGPRDKTPIYFLVYRELRGTAH